MPTFLMSFPAPRWRIRGGENFRSTVAKQARVATSPRAALLEWLGLCDAMSRLGARIVVMPPPAVEPPLTGMMYTANSGALFPSGFTVSKMSVAHRHGEREPIVRFLGAAGFTVDEAPHVWEGQADITTLPGSRYLLTWGVRSVRESVDDVKRRLPSGAQTLELKLRDPWFHGDTCLNPLTTADGRTVLLAHEGALVDRTLDELRAFVGAAAEVLPVDEKDALGYACNALGVAGTVLLPRGLSKRLLDQLRERGFRLEELELSELFGKGGGGPRCLVNELRGVDDGKIDETLTYAKQRDQLAELAKRYPDSVEETT